MATAETIRAGLEVARRDLLDMSARNRLLNTPRHRTRSKTIEIIEELAAPTFGRLVREGKAMSFVPGRGPDPDEQDGHGQDDDDAPSLAQPDDEPLGPDGLPERQTDARLQTRLASDQLQKRLLGIYYDARTLEEEQGVSSLYLALGFLKWFESPSSDTPRFAPLLLVPVDLERTSANARFRLRARDEDMATNISLQAKLRGEFGIELPDLPEEDDLSPEAYFDAVAQAVASQPRWEVERNGIVLGFFSFAKFLMYRDLAPETWPATAGLDRHPLIAGLLQEGFGHESPLCGDDDPIDDLIPPRDTVHVMDADSSQALVIEEVRRGRHLVVQGPPGTGKSQTITNLIATAVREGRRVLFVAEKMAALNVVKDRLRRIGLGDLCLELHSHNANKKAVLADLQRTLDLGCPRSEDFDRQAEQVRVVRDRLNHHAEVLHRPLDPSGVTPYQVLGELVRLRAAGVPAADFTLGDPAAWTRTQYEQTMRLLDDLRVHLREVGNPAKHPWRDVGRETPLLPSDVQRLNARLSRLAESLRTLIRSTRQLADQLHRPQTDNEIGPGAAQGMARLAQKLIAAPPMDRRALADPVWENQRATVAQLVETGQALAQCRAELDGVVADVAWETDLAETRRHLAASGRSWLRWLSGSYRKAQANLRGLLVGPPPKGLDERLRIVDLLIRAQRSRTVLETDDQRGRSAFGALWRRADSDWPALAAVVQWEGECRDAKLPRGFRQMMADLDEPASLREPLREVVEHLKPAFQEMQSLTQDLPLDLPAAFGRDDLRTISFSAWLARIEDWQNHPEALSKWIAYHIRRKRLEAEGLEDLAAHLHDGSIPAEDALDRFQLAYYEDLMREVFRRAPEIAAFEGPSHDQWVAEFRRLDLERIQLARCEVALAHHRGIPRGAADIGEMRTIRHEIEKRRNHKPIRQLLKEAGTAIQAIKPVFMMSPVSVAQFLEPGALQFDLLLIDEASQIRPVDALGAVARARQIVVVGDERQLPPTSFFTKTLDGDAAEGDGEQGANAADLESILGLCVSQNMPQRMLRWHYRSHHHSLIAVSNREFYDNRLYVVPSPTTAASDQGLKFHHISEGVFDRGGTATNRIEAKAVARGVIAHARRHADQSLSVGTFSAAQRDAVLDELELLRRENPDVEAFFSTGRPDPFFVKSLENIQGDERDVIFISVGYARDKSGFLSMSFGPLSLDGGERRLNVLITRARERCEVFSSITADDIDLHRATGQGPAALKTFLTYAARGVLDIGRPSGHSYGSDFERQVAEAIRRCGYDVDLQVGVAGFFIDLAVIDPAQPGRYLLGIECDGATYHSSRSARDRDRLRQQVLEDRRWTIHRIWSTDWFKRPDEQLRKTLAAIEAARIARPEETPPPDDPESDAALGDGLIERAAPPAEDPPASEAEPYTEAAFPIDASQPIHEVAVPKLAQIVTRIVEIEWPIHEDEVARRVTTLWGQTRTGPRIAAAVAAALDHAVRKGHISREGSFCFVTNHAEVPVRSRQGVSSAGLRKPEMLPPAEIRSAVLRVASDHLGARRDDVVVVAARLFGFRATSAQLKSFIEQQLDALIAEQRLRERDAKVFLG